VGPVAAPEPKRLRPGLNVAIAPSKHYSALPSSPVSMTLYAAAPRIHFACERSEDGRVSVSLNRLTSPDSASAL